MFKAFKLRRRNREIVDALFATLVEAARQPPLYARMGVPDTPLGRFEALGVHVHLLLRRCAGDPALKALSQDVLDRFMTDLDASIRELGVGDQSVPKRMKKLAGMFYERVAGYDAAYDGPEPLPALAAALPGRVLPPGTDPAGDAARALAAYMIEARDAMNATSDEDILAGALKTKHLP
ncbi:ubiquinol-cytochrome C chaperone family protein [Aurantimonas sp. Leaf443]|uniref:ubiquinol-cytochrome C chaperone family protein n=1 Tax=Aurantimonas sp. Leaf443 TaxID=1736378 RepID=UPI0009E8E317|nr:ubiquinol-cytochrome C chaperone family protein [Aurantimonas sp. Leaf443]